MRSTHKAVVGDPHTEVTPVGCVGRCLGGSRGCGTGGCRLLTPRAAGRLLDVDDSAIPYWSEVRGLPMFKGHCEARSLIEWIRRNRSFFITGKWPTRSHLHPLRATLPRRVPTPVPLIGLLQAMAGAVVQQGSIVPADERYGKTPIEAFVTAWRKPRVSSNAGRLAMGRIIAQDVANR